MNDVVFDLVFGIVVGVCQVAIVAAFVLAMRWLREAA